MGAPRHQSLRASKSLRIKPSCLKLVMVIPGFCGGGTLALQSPKCRCVAINSVVAKVLKLSSVSTCSENFSEAVFRQNPLQVSLVLDVIGDRCGRKWKCCSRVRALSGIKTIVTFVSRFAQLNDPVAPNNLFVLAARHFLASAHA